jgi:hypothetical protein
MHTASWGTASIFQQIEPKSARRWWGRSQNHIWNILYQGSPSGNRKNCRNRRGRNSYDRVDNHNGQGARRQTRPPRLTRIMTPEERPAEEPYQLAFRKIKRKGHFRPMSLFSCKTGEISGPPSPSKFVATVGSYGKDWTRRQLGSESVVYFGSTQPF